MYIGLNELREKFLKFFESKQHLRLPSFSLVPQNDNSLLLINSGMAPMKKYFTREITPPSDRVTTCQKCIRTPDIERVGITARHGTYFEMLGNFSFGDYFKTDATAWAWEFFTEVLKMPKDLLYISVYEDDDETYEIWTKQIGVAEDHLVRLGKEDNFWEHGSGPCGPCSEIHFDRGAEKGCGSPDCKVGCDCDRFVEVWNLVFTQFESDGKGNYTPLDNPNIDTGMGLERLACVIQGVDNLFLVDTVQNIMKHISKITQVKYGTNDKSDVSLRVITDHIRSTTFMISDGVMPSNEGRGYVLRRLLRRAARHGKLLGVTKPFLYEVAETVIKENELAYPELKEKQELIIKLIKIEEENFAKTIDQGLNLLNSIIESKTVSMLSGEDAFKLNDTYGFPIDLIKEILQEKSITTDEDRYYELLSEQKKRSREARKNAGVDAWISENIELSELASTEFFGYEKEETESKILAIIKEGQKVTSAVNGENVVAVLDRTPFYAESGGQIGDTGILLNDVAKIEITNTTKDSSDKILHIAKITEGVISVGDSVTATIDKNKRNAIKRNHTAAHLLQAALRKVLGNHVEQAGQLVTEKSVRFDFTHFSPMTQKEINKTEELVNSAILEALVVSSQEMPIEKSKEIGATALFGEKYGDVVRVVDVNGFSTELCGGTHVNNTSKLGLFKIKQEGSVAAGVRRIEGVTALGVLEMLDNSMNTLNLAAANLKINNVKELAQATVKFVEDLKDKEKKIIELSSKLSVLKIDELIQKAQDGGKVKIIVSKLKDTNADMLHTMCDIVIDRVPNAVAVFADVTGGKITFACACGKEAQGFGIKAGNVVKAIAQIAGGNGGGRPDKAMAGAKDVSKVNEALESVEKIINEIR